MSSKNDPNRDKVAAKIRALLAKTVASGCTEDEAVAAAEMAAKLLERYDLSLDEVEMRANPFTLRTDTFEDDVASRLWKCASTIADLTHTRYWTSRSSTPPIEISFFGFEHEVAIASYLLAICERAMRNGVATLDRDLLLMRRNVRRRRRGAFLDGMADTLARRIREKIPHRPPGTGLVPLHETLIDKELKRRQIHISSSLGLQSFDLDPSYERGRIAGDHIALDPGVEPSRPAAGALAPARRRLSEQDDADENDDTDEACQDQTG